MSKAIKILFVLILTLVSVYIVWHFMATEKTKVPLTPVNPVLKYNAFNFAGTGFVTLPAGAFNAKLNYTIEFEVKTTTPGVIFQLGGPISNPAKTPYILGYVDGSKNFGFITPDPPTSK